MYIYICKCIHANANVYVKPINVIPKDKPDVYKYELQHINMKSTSTNQKYIHTVKPRWEVPSRPVSLAVASNYECPGSLSVLSLFWKPVRRVPRSQVSLSLAAKFFGPPTSF